MKSFATAILLTLGTAAYAQNNPYSKQIKADAERMGQAMIAKQYDRYIGYLYSGVEQIMPKDEILKRLRQGSEAMGLTGAYFKSVVVGDPGRVIDTANTLQCVVPQELHIQEKEVEVISLSSVIAISEDKGKTWRFMDVAGPDMLMQVRKQVPILSARLKVQQQQTMQVGK